MSEHRFTPGPWTVERPRIRFRIRGPNGEFIFEEGYGVSIEANLRLMAAAPELYEALKAIMEDGAIEQAILEPGRVSMAHAALAKAEGRQIHASSEAAK